MNRTVRRVGKAILILVPLCYFFPVPMLFLFACGVYDVSRNRPLDSDVIQSYFLGNGVFTWVLSPFNVLLDLLSLPYINKGVYKLEDLPGPHQDEIRKLIEAAHKNDLVGQLQKRAEAELRSMFFFKWYGSNVETIVDVPAFRNDFRYIRTIGVSVFNKRESTSRHFGPVRATLRVLYNINDMDDRSAYIEVGGTRSYWKENKLFIFDDTLYHQSFNESDKVRYCLFVDIVRPTPWPAIMDVMVSVIRICMKKANSLFYGRWKIIEREPAPEAR